MIPRIDGLAARLECPTASFLDVDVGVAALSITMARLWPALRVVGIDLWEPALALARQYVADADLGDRIELRQQAVEELADTVCWLKEWAKQLTSQPPTQRDSTGQNDLETILHSVHAQLDEMQKTLNKTYDYDQK